MKFHTLTNGQQIYISRADAKISGVGTCYMLPLGAPERTSFEGEDGPQTVAWYDDLRARDDVGGFDFPTWQTDEQVIADAEKEAAGGNEIEVFRNRTIPERHLEMQRENRSPEGLRDRLEKLERLFPNLADGPAKRAMQGEIDRVKNQLAK